MNGWWWLAAITWAAFIAVVEAVPQAEALRVEMNHRLRPPLPWRERLGRAWRQLPTRLIRPGTQKELAVTGVPLSVYASRLMLFGVLGAFATFLEVTWWAMPVGALAGVAIPRMQLHRQFVNWRMLVVGSSADLVLFLKARLQAGETVEQAIRSIQPHLRGALRVEWNRVIASRDSGAPFRDCLYALGDKLEDRDFNAVMHQLALYDRQAVPEEPFGSLAVHISRMQLLRREYLTRKSTSSITALTGVAMFTAMIAILAPTLYLMFVNGLSGIPL